MADSRPHARLSRGIDFYGPLAFIGLSQVRESAVFSGIPLVERIKEKERSCGVWIVNIETGQTLGFLRFETGVQEIFAVQVLRNMRFPEMLEFNDARLAQSYVLSDEALKHVHLSTEEELQQSPPHHFQRGLQLFRQKKLDEAIAAFQACVKLQPEFPNVRYNLGVALGDAEQFAPAIAALQAVITAEPERAEAYNSLGYLHSRQRQAEQAIQQYEKAIDIQPDYAQAHFNLGMTLLQTGDYERGLVEYDWRWKTGQFTPFQCPHPQWDGSPIPDKTLLLHTEQGAGDAIQFARYIPLAAALCKRLLLVCTDDVAPLFATIPGIAQLRGVGQIKVSDFDTYLPLMSLARVLKTRLDTIPADMPYLDRTAIRRRKDLTALALLPSPSPKIGFVWAGSPTHKNDRHRSCPLEAFLPLLRLPRLSFYSFQKGDKVKDIAQLPAEVQVHDLDAQMKDYGDTAILLDQLDLLISIDTSVVHLAGALGKPVWTLLSHIPDWRWLLEGAETRWYPSMRLFRQASTDDWAGVMEQVAEALLPQAWER